MIREVVESAQGGVFVPPGDPTALAEAVCSLADDEDTCRKMGQSARAYVVAHFERAQQAEKLLHTLGELTRIDGVMV